MRIIEFNGAIVEYDEWCLQSWKWQKAIAVGTDAKRIEAIETLLRGKDEEVADQIGDDMETMGELIAAIVEDSAKAKN